MKNRFSKQQMNYAAAKAIFDVAYEESRKYDRLKVYLDSSQGDLK